MANMRKWALNFFVTCMGVLFVLVGERDVHADSHLEAETFMNDYLDTFDTGHIWQITPLYNDPFFMMAPSGEVKVFDGTKKIKKSIKDWKFWMKKSGVATSRYVQLNVWALSPDPALASAEVERADEHGEIRANTGATYTLIRVDGQWKIYLIHLHLPDRVFNFQ